MNMKILLAIWGQFVLLLKVIFSTVNNENTDHLEGCTVSTLAQVYSAVYAELENNIEEEEKLHNRQHTY